MQKKSEDVFKKHRNNKTSLLATQKTKQNSSNKPEMHEWKRPKKHCRDGAIEQTAGQSGEKGKERKGDKAAMKSKQ